jgi:hypothetical protein
MITMLLKSITAVFRRLVIEIERIIGVSHVTVSNWVKSFNIKPSHANYHLLIFNHLE